MRAARSTGSSAARYASANGSPDFAANARIAGAAGAGNLTVVVADESDPGMLLRTFEAFAGLPTVSDHKH